MRIFHRAMPAAGLAAALSACASLVPERAGDAPNWVDERAAAADRETPPPNVPLVLPDVSEAIVVAATARALLERAEQVRERAADIADETVDTQEFVRDSLTRGSPPAGPGAR